MSAVTIANPPAACRDASPPNRPAYQWAAGQMDAALGFSSSRPTTGANAFAGGDAPRASLATQRREALGGKRMTRQIVVHHVTLNVGLGPMGERVDLDPLAIDLDDLQGFAPIVVKPFATGYPGVEAGQCRLQGRHLAQGAAGVRIARP